jgi:hypothetical protein
MKVTVAELQADQIDTSVTVTIVTCIDNVNREKLGFSFLLMVYGPGYVKEPGSSQVPILNPKEKELTNLLFVSNATLCRTRSLTSLYVNTVHQRRK